MSSEYFVRRKHVPRSLSSGQTKRLREKAFKEASISRKREMTLLQLLMHKLLVQYTGIPFSRTLLSVRTCTANFGRSQCTDM